MANKISLITWKKKKHAIVRVKNYVVYLAISIKQSGRWTCMKIGAKPNKIEGKFG